jgi:deazaflavin-dependent oxidoreductase (nitroreductase family)
MYFKDGENYIITASNNGRNRHPRCFYNLKGIPHVSKEVPGRQLQVNAFIADDKDKEKYWSIRVSRAPFFENYRRGTTRNIPVVVLKLA